MVGWRTLVLRDTKKPSEVLTTRPTIRNINGALFEVMVLNEQIREERRDIFLLALKSTSAFCTYCKLKFCVFMTFNLKVRHIAASSAQRNKGRKNSFMTVNSSISLKQIYSYFIFEYFGLPNISNFLLHSIHFFAYFDSSYFKINENKET